MQSAMLKKTFRSINIDCKFNAKNPIFGVNFGFALVSRNINKRGYSHQAHLNKLECVAPNTLQSRLLIFLRTNEKYNSFKYKQNNRICQAQPLVESVYHLCDPRPLPIGQSQSNKLMDADSEILPRLNSFLSSLQHPTLSSKEFLSLLPVVDEKCCMELKNMNSREILMMLDAWMHILPHKIGSLDCYKLVVCKMKNWLSSSDINLSAEEFILIMFYAGLLKKSQQANEIMILSLQYMDQSSFNFQNILIEELCILASAVFKTSTQIKSTKLLAAINNTIQENSALLSDPAIFITLIKVLRFAQFYNQPLLDEIASKIIADESIITQMNFTAKAHLLAFYAGALYSTFDIIGLLVNSSLKDLQSLTGSTSNKITSYLSVKPRSKDISRFLWAISFLDFRIHDKYIEDTIVPLLTDMLKRGEYGKNPEEIVDSLLSLWISGFKPENLLTQALTENILSTLRNKNKLRYNSRLALLFTCISIEAKHLINSEQMRWKNSIAKLKEPNVSRHLAKRPSLKKVYATVSNLAGTLEFVNVACSFLIPHLHIAGIKVETGSGVFCIELLDKSVLLHESNRLQGLMQLKLRLLNAMGCPVLLISAKEVDAFEETSDLYVFLEDKIRSFKNNVGVPSAFYRMP